MIRTELRDLISIPKNQQQKKVIFMDQNLFISKDSMNTVCVFLKILNLFYVNSKS